MALKDTIIRGDFNPFTGFLYSQDGSIGNERDRSLTPEEIITMDWLAENVNGHIPVKEELLPDAQTLIAYQGLEPEEKLL